MGIWGCSELDSLCQAQYQPPNIRACIKPNVIYSSNAWQRMANIGFEDPHPIRIVEAHETEGSFLPGEEGCCLSALRHLAVSQFATFEPSASARRCSRPRGVSQNISKYETPKWLAWLGFPLKHPRKGSSKPSVSSHPLQDPRLSMRTHPTVEPCFPNLILAVDSPLFSTIVLFKHRLFPLGF